MTKLNYSGRKGVNVFVVQLFLRFPSHLPLYPTSLQQNTEIEIRCQEKKRENVIRRDSDRKRPQTSDVRLREQGLIIKDKNGEMGKINWGTHITQKMGKHFDEAGYDSRVPFAQKQRRSQPAT